MRESQRRDPENMTEKAANKMRDLKSSLRAQAKQSNTPRKRKDWIASVASLLAMTANTT
jgi:hypothetical protein